jgi:hypothetical protein
MRIIGHVIKLINAEGENTGNQKHKTLLADKSKPTEG